MALIVMILRKMVKNKWLELSLLLGLIMSVALISSIPIYTNAILHRMLIKDLENVQEQTNEYPGSFSAVSFFIGNVSNEVRKQTFNRIDDYMAKQGDSFGLPLQLYKRERSTETMALVPVDPTKVDSATERNGDVTAMSDLAEHVRLIDGRLPEKEPVNGVYEALVIESVLDNLKLVLGNEFLLQSNGNSEPIRIKPVGVIESKDYSDVYWQTKLTNYSSSFFIDYDLFEKEFTQGYKLKVVSGAWSYAHEYNKMTLGTVDQYLSVNDRIDTFFSDKNMSFSLKAPAVATINKYFEEEKKLKLMLWSLNVPVIIMLAYYLYMVANLITDRQKTEISVIRSRGASRLQILCGFIIEGLLLGGIAYLIGPYIGLNLTKVLGASSGFLEFVQRSALDAKIGQEAYRYALLAMVSAVFMTLIPAFLATRVTIVGHKQQLARRQGGSFWHKYYIDVALMGMSLYGLLNFKRRMNDLLALGLDSADFKVDPLLFLIPALFVLSMGLLILRIYPYAIQFVYWLGRKWWPPSLYSTMIQVGRSITQYQFIMLFLIITVATGLFSASAARTMNQNTSDQIRYIGGADITLTTKWENDRPSEAAPSVASTPIKSDAAADVLVKNKIQYAEPPFQIFSQLPGVETATKVFNKDNAQVHVGKNNGITRLMGIETKAFGQVSWLRDHLLDHHFYDYLNLIAVDPSAVLISKSIADQFGAKVGDHISLNWSGTEEAQFIVYGIIGYWPNWNPNPKFDDNTTTTAKANDKANLPNLVIGHLSYIQKNIALEPYDVWLKLKPDASMPQLYRALEEQKIKMTRFTNAKQELSDSKKDPFRLAVNGVMTLGFMISILITFLGFLLYWVLSLASRTLQFGILRAMGISFWQLIGMLVAEQILTSGAAIFIGMVTGNVTSKLFVPLFQLSFNTTTQVPPFLVKFDPLDQIRLYLIVSLMIVLGLLILGTMLSRIKIHQAVKLGED